MDGYQIASSEAAKLTRLYEKYGTMVSGMNSMNSVNSGGGMEAPPAGQEPLII